MFGIKTYIKNRLKTFYPATPSDVFPETGTASIRIRLQIKDLKNMLKQRNISNNLGWLYTLPHKFAVENYKDFLEQNPNHLGNWSTGNQKLSGTYEIEREVIHKMVDLYNAKTTNFEGYISSGATESNLFAMWTGKKYLEKYYLQRQICLIRTSLTHYSVTKSADIVGLTEFISPLNTDQWGLDPKCLEITITNLRDKGFKGFLLPLTLGYTQTGTNDNLESITKITQYLSKRLNVRFFIWVDAALNGLIAPFLDPGFAPFSYPNIQAFVVDFHKFGLVPYPAGIIIYQKKLRNLIEKTIDYLPQSDNTILGSRPGASAIAIWSMIQLLGKYGYYQLVRKQLSNKTYFLNKLKTFFPNIQIITDKTSLNCGIMFSSFDEEFPKKIADKYGLFTKETTYLFAPSLKRKLRIYKFYFLPHIKRSVIDSFFADLNYYYKLHTSD